MTTLDTWIRRWLPRPSARSRVICFPWAGGGAVSFRRLAVALPPEVELCAVEYPGRGSRGLETCWPSVTRLSQAIGGVTRPLLDRPFVVVGFSLGALVAFEWARALAARGEPTPAHFLPCARRAPHLPQRLPTVHGLPEEEMLAEIQGRFGPIPEVLLQERELLSRFLVPLRADLQAVESYAYQPGMALPCPITAVGGKLDPDVSAAELGGWGEHTTGRFEPVLLESGHFFHESEDFLRVLTERALQGPGFG